MKKARQRGFIFIQRHKLTIKNYSLQRYIKICYYLKLQTPIMHRQFFIIISQIYEFIERFCNNGNNPFPFSIRKWIINQ